MKRVVVYFSTLLLMVLLACCQEKAVARLENDIEKSNQSLPTIVQEGVTQGRIQYVHPDVMVNFQIDENKIDMRTYKVETEENVRRMFEENDLSIAELRELCRRAKANVVMTYTGSKGTTFQIVVPFDKM